MPLPASLGQIAVVRESLCRGHGHLSNQWLGDPHRFRAQAGRRRAGKAKYSLHALFDFFDFLVTCNLSSQDSGSDGRVGACFGSCIVLDCDQLGDAPRVRHGSVLHRFLGLARGWRGSGSVGCHFAPRAPYGKARQQQRRQRRKCYLRQRISKTQSAGHV